MCETLCGIFSRLCICRGTRSPPDPSELISALRSSLVILLDQSNPIDSSLALWLGASFGTIWRGSSSTTNWSYRLLHAALLPAIGGGLVALMGRQIIADHALYAIDRREVTRVDVQALISSSSSLLQISVCLLLSSLAARFEFSTPLVWYLAAICMVSSSLLASVIAFRLGGVVAQTFTRRLRPLASATLHAAYLPNSRPRRTGEPDSSLGPSWADASTLFLKVSLAVSSTVVRLRRLKKFKLSSLTVRLHQLFIIWLVPATVLDPPLQKVDSIVQKDADTWCFRPGDSLPTQPPLACNNATLSTLMDAHINNTLSSGLSIAYYDLGDASVLGGASWADWNSTALPVGLCMSGAVADGTVAGQEARYVTVCRFTDHDRDHDYNYASAKELQCIAALPQKFVSDGCYDPQLPIGPRAASTPWDAIIIILLIVVMFPVLHSIVYSIWKMRARARARARARTRTRAQEETAIPELGLLLSPEPMMAR